MGKRKRHRHTRSLELCDRSIGEWEERLPDPTALFVTVWEKEAVAGGAKLAALLFADSTLVSVLEQPRLNTVQNIGKKGLDPTPDGRRCRDRHPYSLENGLNGKSGFFPRSGQGKCQHPSLPFIAISRFCQFGTLLLGGIFVWLPL
ncbi:hypothetical protein B0H14DRAFT_2583649 [Mycena olivaceomarginata]|nr:hypothetical protein B0H14DRAFT_2583649 [Mycena olivaceomarginata]